MPSHTNVYKEGNNVKKTMIKGEVGARGFSSTFVSLLAVGEKA